MLRWQQDWGTKQEYWELKVAAGQRAPDPFYEKPEVSDGTFYIWQAFHELGTERQIGMGFGPIPRSHARAYALEIGIHDEDEFDRFWSILRKVDAEYLKIANASDKDADPVADRDRRKPQVNAKPVSRKKQA